MTQESAAGQPAPTGMPEEPVQALRFGKARTARSTALLEDYVELIADLLATKGEARAIEVAKRLGVSHPTALKSIGRLKPPAQGNNPMSLGMSVSMTSGL